MNGSRQIDWGKAIDGSTVKRVTLTGGGLTAQLLSWGCVLQDLRLDGHQPPLVLGFERFEYYVDHSPFFGATAGRYANRISGGTFQIGDQRYQLDRNYLGKHHLHGGSASLARRNWRFSDVQSHCATLEIDDPDGTMGYPGDCHLSATFALLDDGCLSIRYAATSSLATIINLAHHSYFNLDGRGDILGHKLSIAAEHYLDVDDELIPTGDPRKVADTPFDFRIGRPVGLEIGGHNYHYDHNFCLSRQRVECREVAKLTGPRSGISMSVWTSEPGLQFYDGLHVGPPVAGLDGMKYGARSGLCLEPQIWPDAPNRHDFPTAVVERGETYRQHTQYRFSLPS